MILSDKLPKFIKKYLSRVCGDDPMFPRVRVEDMLFVPRMRGWSQDKQVCFPSLHICPAYAGMILLNCLLLFCLNHLSRVCGDDPHRQIINPQNLRFVPRMRGWSHCKSGKWNGTIICPAYAGMILLEHENRAHALHLSRVCGDDPLFFPSCIWKHLFVPRMRGWSLASLIKTPTYKICPAYAGMILLFWHGLTADYYLSRVCGDDPGKGGDGTFLWTFVPRMRGWSSPTCGAQERRDICPAYAGMILLLKRSGEKKTYLSRVCGDDPSFLHHLQ